MIFNVNSKIQKRKNKKERLQRLHENESNSFFGVLTICHVNRKDSDICKVLLVHMGTHFRLSMLHPKYCTVFFCILVRLQQGKVWKAGVTTPDLSTQIKCTSRSVLSVLIFHPPDTQHSNTVRLDESNIHTPLKEKKSLTKYQTEKKKSSSKSGLCRLWLLLRGKIKNHAFAYPDKNSAISKNVKSLKNETVRSGSTPFKSHLQIWKELWLNFQKPCL